MEDKSSVSVGRRTKDGDEGGRGGGLRGGLFGGGLNHKSPL